MLALDVLALSGCAAATTIDLIERRIPNLLTGPLIGIGVLIHVIGTPLPGGVLGLPSPWLGLAGLAVAGVPFFLLYAFKVVGAGDVKLLMAVGALLGPVSALRIGLFTVLTGAILSLVTLVATARLGRLALHVRYGWYRLTGRSDVIAPTTFKAPMGLAILAAVALEIALVHQEALAP